MQKTKIRNGINMIYNKSNEIFEYEGKTYMIGEEIYVKSSAYRGLIGKITEIHTGEDKETLNEEPDIYCDFYTPMLLQDKESLKTMCGSLENVCFDGIIMSPEMIVALSSLNKNYPSINVYALIEDWVIEGDGQCETIKIFTTYEQAQIEMRKCLNAEMHGGCLKIWSDNENYVEEQNEDYFKGYLDDLFCSEHYIVHIEEITMPLTDDFVDKIVNIGLENDRRKSIKEQIETWEISENVKQNVINDPTLYERIREALNKNDTYNEAYWETVSEVAHELVKEHNHIEDVLSQAKKGGKV
ncbi:MAG: hypothetical protein IJX99_08370 [Clostridia bacterium]|nr:hypothetical protein [Clostridia bacterium]